MSLSKNARFKILARDRFTCRYCGRSAPAVELHVDHVHPVSLGGSDHPTNLVAACVDCNSSKSGTPLPLLLEQEITAAAPRRAHARTFAHPDRCPDCREFRLCAAVSESPYTRSAARGTIAGYRCTVCGARWMTWWSDNPANRLTADELSRAVNSQPECVS